MLSKEQLSRLKAAAVIPTNWHTNPTAVDAETLADDFRALQKAVNGSKFAKVLWLLVSAPVVLYLLWQAVMFGVGILFQPVLG